MDMAHFTKDIVTDILSRLPVKPLLRFRCVSKIWCALIDSRHFVKLHLKMSKETRNNGNLILSHSISYSISIISMHSLDCAISIDDHPLRNCTKHRPQVFGSCDGLVLLCNTRKDEIVIWNPFTRKYHKLPVTGSVISEKHYFTICSLFIRCGIGYDVVHDDYKVVKIGPYYDGIGRKKHDDAVCIYSLKLNSWRRIQDFPYEIVPNSTNTYGNFASGSLHWVVSRKGQKHGSDRFVAALDLATEQYRLVPMPNFYDDKSLHLELATLEGRLCILCMYLFQHIDVWEMKDYGVRDSWNKLFSVALHIETIQDVVPLALSKDGAKVLLMQHLQELIWFDLNCNAVETVNVRGLPIMFEPVFCAQSLVSLGRGGESNEEKPGPKEIWCTRHTT